MDHIILTNTELTRSAIGYPLANLLNQAIMLLCLTHSLKKG
uniref:Uncharacterized protein n=1 Tax=Arundo donax TaxID=35708 RepID=A0A0A9BRP7_ARUDO